MNNKGMNLEIANEYEVLSFFKEKYGHKPKKIYAYYTSELDKVITQEHLMLIPIDERIATRAHGAFDVAYLKKGKLINLNAHVNRLLSSAQSVGINFPMKAPQLIQKVIGTVKNAIKSVGIYQLEEIQKLVWGVRVSISSGHGDFGIASLAKHPVFYIAIFQPYINYEIEKQGVNQFIVMTVKGVPEHRFVHAKTMNYLQNSLMANDSKAKGGYMGIKALQNGILLQAAVANIAFIFGKQFATPRFQTVIEGTTIKTLLKYINNLIQIGEIEKISFRDITIDQAIDNADEMMIIGGDKIVPVLNFNGVCISKTKGKITKLCQQWYQEQIEKGENVSIIQYLI